MVVARDFKDAQGNVLVTLEHRYDNDAYRIEISRFAMEQLRRGDAFLIAMGSCGTPFLSVQPSWTR